MHFLIKIEVDPNLYILLLTIVVQNFKMFGTA
jgi:hypothetical protein